MKIQGILFETCDIYPEMQQVCLDQNPLQTESEHLKSYIAGSHRQPDIIVGERSERDTLSRSSMKNAIRIYM